MLASSSFTLTFLEHHTAWVTVAILIYGLVGCAAWLLLYRLR